MHVQGIATVLGDCIRRQTQNGERERPAGVYLCLRAAAIAQYWRNWASDSALSFALPNGSPCFIAETTQASTIFSVSNWSHAVSARSVDTTRNRGARRRPHRERNDSLLAVEH